MVSADDVPGMKPGHRWRNVLVGAVIVLVVLGAIGAVAGPDEEEPGQDSEPADGTTPATTTTATPMADGGGADADEPTTSTVTPTSTATATPTPEPTLSTLTSIEDVPDRYDGGHETFSGSDNSVTGEFTTDGGPIVFVYEHSGESNFIAEVIDTETGERVGLAANVVGEASGARAIPDDGGTYRLEVTADGPWSIDVSNPMALEEDINQLPVEASGEGATVLGPLHVDGRTLVEATHEGESNFIVYAMDELAFNVLERDLAINEVGQFDGEGTFDFDGMVWITVEADGPWTLYLEDF